MADDRYEGTINGEPFSLPAGFVPARKGEIAQGKAALALLGELDRSAHGRHEGDAESQDPTGISQGNQLLPAGTHIGHHISGRRIVVPPWRQLTDPDAWIEEAPNA